MHSAPAVDPKPCGTFCPTSLLETFVALGAMRMLEERHRVLLNVLNQSLLGARFVGIAERSDTREHLRYN